MKNEQDLMMISPSELVSYPNHLFSPMPKETFDALKRSIKEVGILQPILVTKKKGEYIILAGHNRVKAAKELSLKEVPVLVKNDLSSASEDFIVVASNLIQRQFSDLTYKERVDAISTYYHSAKLLKIEISGGVRETDIKKSMGQKFSLSIRSINRYLMLERAEKLVELLDNGKITFRLAVSAASIPTDYLLRFIELFEGDIVPFNEASIALLKNACKKSDFDIDDIENLFFEEYKEPIKDWYMPRKIRAKYFSESMTDAEINAVVEKALDMYFEK